MFADGSVSGKLAGLDLLIESEHGPDSSAYLVTDSRAVAEEALNAISEYWKVMNPQRVEFSRSVLSGSQGGIILTESVEDAIEFVNDYAPEHLAILSKDPFRYLGEIVNAGEILMGPHTPLTLGNYVLGPNAVLPTSKAARTASPLSVFDFMKRTSIGYVTESGYGTLARHAYALARYEGFDAHANAVSNLRHEAIAGML